MGRNPGAAGASDLSKITWLSARRNSGFIPPLSPVSPRLCCQRCRNICASHGLLRVGVCAITAAALPLWEPVRLLMLPVMSPVLPRHPGQQASTAWMALFFQGCRMCPVEQSSSSPRAQLSLSAGWELPSLSPWIGRQRAHGQGGRELQGCCAGDLSTAPAGKLGQIHPSHIPGCSLLSLHLGSAGRGWRSRDAAAVVNVTTPHTPRCLSPKFLA